MNNPERIAIALLAGTTVLACLPFMADTLLASFPAAKGYSPEWVSYLYRQELMFIGLSFVALLATVSRPGIHRVFLRCSLIGYSGAAIMNILKLAYGAQPELQALQFGFQIATALFSFSSLVSLYLPHSLGGGRYTGLAPLLTYKRLAQIADEAEHKARLAIKTENHLHHHLLASSAKQALIMRYLADTLEGTAQEKEMLAAAADDAQWMHHTIQAYVTNPDYDAGTAD